MVQRPIIKLPNPRNSAIPPKEVTSGGGFSKPKGPGLKTQTQRYEPTFNRLDDVLKKDNSALELRGDPLGMLLWMLLGMLLGLLLGSNRNSYFAQH